MTLQEFADLIGAEEKEFIQYAQDCIEFTDYPDLDYMQQDDHMQGCRHPVTHEPMFYSDEF